MAWVYLVLAGIFECGWVIGIKYTNGFTKPIASMLTITAVLISLWLLSLAMKTIPIGTAYAIWAGIGTVGVSLLGILLFNESKDVVRIICLFFIIAGIVGLKLVSYSSTSS